MRGRENRALGCLILSVVGGCGAAIRPEEVPRPIEPFAGREFLYLGTEGAKSIFRIDPATGELTSEGQIRGGGPLLALGPESRFLYAAGATDVTAYAIDQKTGALSPIGDSQKVAGMPFDLSVHPSGDWLFLLLYDQSIGTTRSIDALPILREAGLAAAVRSDYGYLQGEPALQVASGAGGFVLVSRYSWIETFSFDPAVGTVTPGDPPRAKPRFALYPRRFAFSPSGRYVYALDHRAAESVASYRYDPATGHLQEEQVVPLNEDGCTYAEHIAVHPSGKYVYGGIGHCDNASKLAIFSADETTGRLTPLGFETAGGLLGKSGAFRFAVDPAGRLLVVTTVSTGAGDELVPQTLIFRIRQDGTLDLLGPPRPDAYGYNPVIAVLR